MTLGDTEGDEERRGGADAPVRAGPPGPANAEPGGSAAGQGTRPTASSTEAVAGFNTMEPSEQLLTRARFFIDRRTFPARA